MGANKILYFDDEMSLAMPLVANLERKGLKVKLVSTIHDFYIELKSETTYNLIILDIMSPMPKESSDEMERFSNDEINQMNNGLKTGEVLFSNLRKIKKYENIPVLFYSIKRFPIIKSNNTDYIRKPELASEIFDKINELINQ